ncbi:MAG TPA: hypothetical protein VIU38_00100 [Anaerolineales bacterium]
MRGRRLQPAIVLIILALGITAALVMPLSGRDQSAAEGANSISHIQESTPTPIEGDRSVAGSTDGILWMGIAITAIVLLPLLANRLFAARQP